MASDLINRQALLQLLYKKWLNKMPNRTCFFLDGEIQRTAEAETIEKVMKEIEGMPAVEPMKWIPCSEGIPTENGNYLVTVRSWDETANVDFMDVEHCNSDGYWLHYHDSAKNKKGRRVIAWMPLPEPYKDGDKD